MRISYLYLGLLSLLFCAACGSNSGAVTGFVPTGNFSNASLNGNYVYQIEGLDFSTTTNGWVQVEAGWHDAWAHQCQEAIDWVEGRVAEPISRAERGRAVQEIMMALFESARKKQRVYLPLKTRINPLRLMVEHGDLPVEWPGEYESRARIVRGEGMSWQTSS